MGPMAFAAFNLFLSVYVFFTLKAVGPIDFHYMTEDCKGLS